MRVDHARLAAPVSFLQNSHDQPPCIMSHTTHCTECFAILAPNVSLPNLVAGSRVFAYCTDKAKIYKSSRPVPGLLRHVAPTAEFNGDPIERVAPARNTPTFPSPSLSCPRGWRTAVWRHAHALPSIEYRQHARTHTPMYRSPPEKGTDRETHYDNLYSYSYPVTNA